ncbi:MAG TPA: TRAM domain-containing protein, partial [Luteolibacter sp.]|nr:TRAM domain-containing protein [Luteolibacter sp.]
VFCEGPSKNNAAKLSGRTFQSKIVIFDGNADRFTGRMVEVKIEASTGFTLYGSVI